MISEKLSPVIRVLIVFGTRPEAIKMAPLVLKMKENPDLFELKVCVTGQHRELLDQVLQIFNIIPDIDLNVMKPGQALGDLTAQILTNMSHVIDDVKPEIVMVHGDTTTTLATSLASYYKGVRIGHVEAGLRTYNVQSPFPEEFNRQLVSKIADIHFAPTEHCKINLLSENVSLNSIFVTGNSVIDALQWILKRLATDEKLREPIRARLNKQLSFSWESEKFVLVTGHRRENFGSGFLEICNALSELATVNPDIHFVYPVHLNPNVQKPVHSILGELGNIHLIEPLDYLAFSMLLQKCFFVLTVSGGLQEEAPSLGKPVLVMRDNTERPEAVDAGTVILVGTDKEKIVNQCNDLLNNSDRYHIMSSLHNPYGDGKACQRIVDHIISLNKKNE